MLNSLNSAEAKRGYRHAIDEFVDLVLLGTASNRAPSGAISTDIPPHSQVRIATALISNPVNSRAAHLTMQGPAGGILQRR